MKDLTIDRVIELLQNAKERIGGDKPVVVTVFDGHYPLADHGKKVADENDWAHFSANLDDRSNFGFSIHMVEKVP